MQVNYTGPHDVVKCKLKIKEGDLPASFQEIWIDQQDVEAAAFLNQFTCIRKGSYRIVKNTWVMP